jgi:choline dehydrogenase-like flavoprotein
LFDDAGLDSARDMSTLFVTASSGGVPRAAGRATVNAAQFLDQLVSLDVTEAGTHEAAAAARAGYFTFVNDQLHEVYPSLPFLLRADPNRYLSAFEWRALMLTATAVLPRPLPASGPTLKDVATNLQNFVRSADATALEQVRNALGWLGLAEPLLSGHVDGIRKLLRKVLAEPKPSLARAMAEQLHQLAVLPYFSHPKADHLVGYARPQFTPLHNTTLPISRLPSDRTFDVAIVGAGIAGSILADRLSAKGLDVLLLEAGPYVAERDISTDDLAMTARLYKSSGLQTANQGNPDETPMTVLQGACVGGGGTINNAVCFQLPESQLKAWQAVGFPISTDQFRAAYQTTGIELEIKPSSKATTFLNPAGALLEGGFGKAQTPDVTLPPIPGFYECLVNLSGGIRGCEGLGLCNTGCGSERKRNALQVHLPRALRTGRCQLVPDAHIREVRVERGKVTKLIGSAGGTPIEVRAKEYILAAGPIGSSALLLRSPTAAELLSRAGVPVGQRFSANIGSPLFARLSRVVHKRPSLQIAHYYLPPQGSGFICESWYAPPGTLSLTMPGFLDAHWDRMLDYTKLVTAAPLIGTKAHGSIRVRGGKTQIELRLDPDDEVARLKTGAATLARAFLASNDPDLLEVVLGTRDGFVVKTPADVARFEAEVRHANQLRIGTGHPQGGNAMSADNSISVVGADFRVRGIGNLRICDSSVFPAVAGVNPQWTVMALADVCGQVF